MLENDYNINFLFEGDNYQRIYTMVSIYATIIGIIDQGVFGRGA